MLRQNERYSLFCAELSRRISSCLSPPLGPSPPQFAPLLSRLLPKYFFLQKRRGEGCPIELARVFLPREFSIGAGSTRRKFIVRWLCLSLGWYICICICICICIGCNGSSITIRAFVFPYLHPSMMPHWHMHCRFAIWWLTLIWGDHTYWTWTCTEKRSIHETHQGPNVNPRPNHSSSDTEGRFWNFWKMKSYLL